MKKHTVNFLFYTMTSWMLASLAYMLLVRIMPDGAVFGSWYRMHLYHYSYPFQYILVVAVAYGLVTTIWARFLGHLTGWKRALSIIAVMLLSLIVASVPGGILWAIHDIQAGFVPQPSILRENLIWAGTTGLVLGWLIVLLSIPYNIICGLFAFLLTHFGQRYIVERGWG
jgi:hypothetical protein